MAPSPVPKAWTTVAATTPVEFTLVMSTTFHNSGDAAVRSGRVTVPLKAPPQAPSQALLWERITPTPVAVTTDALGNRAAEFDLAGIAPGDSLEVRGEYRLISWGSGGEGSSGPVLPAHLRSAAKIESGAPEIRLLAQAATRGETEPAAKLARLFNRTRELLQYDEDSPVRNHGALAGLGAGTGVCEEYASLFVAMARAVEIPARLVIGFGRDRNSAEDAWGDGGSVREHRHAWAEAYLPDHGWVTFDPTFNRSGLSGVGAASVASGTLIADNYGDRSVKGSYLGGVIEVSRRQTLVW